MHYKEKFVRFLLESGTLTFGDFVLKSGRKSPYMINMGKFDTGIALSRLGCFYARVIYEKQELNIIPWETTILFGSAYKGIPLAAATSVALGAAFDIECGWCFNRKEVKSHGEGGIFVGKKPGAGDKVLIIDDVMTAGTALRDTINLFREHAPDAQVVGSIIAVDRKEHGRDMRLSAIAEAEYELGIPIVSIIDICEIINILKKDAFEKDYYSECKTALPTKEQIAAIEAYLEEYRAV